MDGRQLLAWILVGAGAFSICGGLFDWEWFMNSRRAQFWLKAFGRRGARIFYVVLGVVIVTLGSMMALGVLSSSSDIGK